MSSDKKNINEDLKQLKVEQSVTAAKQAKKLGLSYVGFGRYIDPKTNQVTHIVLNDKLTVFNRAVKTNTFQTNNSDDYGNYGAFVAPELEQIHALMTSTYTPDKYDDNELDAIYAYTNNVASTGGSSPTGGSYADINLRLTSVPTGTPAIKIEKTSLQDTIPEFVETMDSAMKKVRCPIDFMAYTSLSSDFNIDDFQPGRVLKFKGYRNTSINLNAVLNAVQSKNTGSGGRPQVIVLQLIIPKNSRGVYAADFSPNAAYGEFILPRGTVIEVMRQADVIVGSDAISNSLNLEVLYLDCKVKT